MTCRAVRKALPLMAGGDLAAPKAAKVRAHIAGCPACRRESEAFAGVRSAARALAQAGAPALWTDAEWSAAVRRATSSALAPRRGPARVLRPALAYGLAAGLVLGGGAVALRSLRPRPQLQAQVPLAAILGPPVGPVLRSPDGPHATTIAVDPKDGHVRIVWRFGRDLPLDLYGK